MANKHKREAQISRVVDIYDRDALHGKTNKTCKGMMERLVVDTRWIQGH